MFAFSNVESDWMGLYHNQSGYVDVESTVSAYLKLLGELNVTFIENSKLEEIIQSDEDTTYLKFDSNYIKSKKIIMTPGAYINDLTAMLGFQINLGVIKIKEPVTPPSGMRPWRIAVFVIGCITCVAIIIGSICYIRRKRRATDREILLAAGDRSDENVKPKPMRL